MAKLLLAALVAIIVSGALTPAHASSGGYITPEGAAGMLSADDINAQWHVARQICADQGFAEESGQFQICFLEYWTHSLRALGARFKALTDTIAQRHGLCIDRRRSRMVPCTDI